MGRKSKVSNELKIELVKKILEGKGTIQGLSKEYNVAKSSLMTWKKKYLEIGEESIKVENKNRHYSRETKEKAVKSYLNNEGSLFEICKKYDIDLKKSFAYGDTTGDLTMFKAVENAIAINPAKKLFKKIKNNEKLKEKVKIIVERKDIIYQLDANVKILEENK